MSNQIFDHLVSVHGAINTKWQPIHVWLVQRRGWSQPVMRLATLITILILVSATIVYLVGPKYYYLVSQLGVKSADVAVILYIGSLIPGILKRLDILAMPRASMMMFRRELGDLAFLAGMTHGLLVRLLPKFLSPVLIGAIPPLPELIGLLALIVLIPLYATSNDFMIAKLGIWWSRIHRLTYLALGLLIFHTAWFSFQISLLLVFVGIIEIASYTKNTWIKYLPK